MANQLLSGTPRHSAGALGGGPKRQAAAGLGLLGQQVIPLPHVPALAQLPPPVSNLPGSLLAANVSFCARVSLAIRTNASASHGR